MVVCRDFRSLAGHLAEEYETGSEMGFEKETAASATAAEPIDIVYTWVDGSDRTWYEKRQKAFADSNASVTHPLAAHPIRFHNRDELRYSFRSLEMYADFARNVYLITDEQVPLWLNTEHPRLRIVSHRDIFRHSQELPTFNSHAIESRMHHIDGLSEQYIYVNDDVFFGAQCLSSDFFDAEGRAIAYPSNSQIDPAAPQPSDSLATRAAKNNRILMQRIFGATITHKFRHVPHSQLRSVLFEMEARFPKEFEETARHRFRDPEDHSIPSSLSHYYAKFTNRAVFRQVDNRRVAELALLVAGLRRCMPGRRRVAERRFTHTTINLGAPFYRLALERILALRPYTCFCINEPASDPSDPQRFDSVVEEFLSAYFPFKSEFER